MAKKKKPQTKFRCEECKRINYNLILSQLKDSTKKVELKKYCKWCRKHTLHKEAKK